MLEVVNRASESIDHRFTDQPAVEAAIRFTLGKIYGGLGETTAAEAYLRKAQVLFQTEYGTNHDRTLEVQHALAILLRVNKAEYKEAEDLIRNVVKQRVGRSGADSPESIKSLLELGFVLQDQERHHEAGEIFERAGALATASLGAEHRLVLSAREGSIRSIWDGGDREKAVLLNRELLESKRAILGNKHPDTLRSIADMAFYEWTHNRDIWKKERLIEQGLALSRAMYAEKGITRSFERQRSGLLGQRGLLNESLALRRQVLAETEFNAGKLHPQNLVSLLFVAFHETHYAGNDGKAMQIFKEALDKYKKVAPNSYNAQVCRNWLSSMYWRHGRMQEAINLMEENLDSARTVYGPQSERFSRWGRWLGDHYAQLGDWEAAAFMFRTLRETRPLDGENKKTIALIEFLAKDSLISKAQSIELLINFKEEFPFLKQLDVQFPVANLVSNATDSIDLDELSEVLPDLHERVLAGFLLADRLSQPAAQSRSVEELAKATAILQRSLAAGDLGANWRKAAVSSLMQRAVASSVDVNLTMPKIDAQSLNRYRTQWQPIKSSLDQAFSEARNRNWKLAARQLEKTVFSKNFPWEAAETLVSRWPMKLAVVFQLGEHQQGYERLCKFYQKLDATFDSDLYRVSLMPLGDSPKMASIILNARENAFDSETEGLRHVPEWKNLLRGLELAREGRFRQGLEELGLASKAYDLHCVCAAQAFAAQIEFHVGDTNKGRFLLTEAERVFDLLDENHGDRLGTYWFDFGLCRLAVEQGRAALMTLPKVSSENG